MPPPRTPKGIVLLAVVYFLIAGDFALIAGFFAVAPACLRALGFRSDLDASLRLSGLSFFAVAAAMAGAIGYGLWRLKPGVTRCNERDAAGEFSSENLSKNAGSAKRTLGRAA